MHMQILPQNPTRAPLSSYRGGNNLENLKAQQVLLKHPLSLRESTANLTIGWYLPIENKTETRPSSYYYIMTSVLEGHEVDGFAVWVPRSIFGLSDGNLSDLDDLQIIRTFREIWYISLNENIITLILS